jgi:hypothetical protein
MGFLRREIEPKNLAQAYGIPWPSGMPVKTVTESIRSSMAGWTGAIGVWLIHSPFPKKRNQNAHSKTQPVAMAPKGLPA